MSEFTRTYGDILYIHAYRILMNLSKWDAAILIIIIVSTLRNTGA